MVKGEVPDWIGPISPFKPPFKSKSTGKCGFKDVIGKSGWEEFKEEREKAQAEFEKNYVFDDKEFSERLNLLIDYITAVECGISKETRKSITKINHSRYNSNFPGWILIIMEHMSKWVSYGIPLIEFNAPPFKIKPYFITEDKNYKNAFNYIIKIFRKGMRLGKRLKKRKNNLLFT